MGYLKGKSSPMIYGKYQYRNRKFWYRWYYVYIAGKMQRK